MSWTCQRKFGSTSCKHVNDNRKRKCGLCGKARPARKRPKHLVALELSYEEYVALNGGEHCALCGREPSEHRKLDRDHSHSTKRPRGLLCHFCNRWLPERATAEWLRAAADYVERAEREAA
jgi:Recombination endonuclease VII